MSREGYNFVFILFFSVAALFQNFAKEQHKYAHSFLLCITLYYYIYSIIFVIIFNIIFNIICIIN
jgi:hypothetical protein